MLSNCKIAVIIASSGRPLELGRWIDHVERQTLRPVEMIWSVSSEADLPPSTNNTNVAPMTIVQAHHLGAAKRNKGLTTQRNAGLDALRSNPDVIAFFDDDYVPTQGCFAGIATSFSAFPDAVGLTGTLIADGINTPGISFDEASHMIRVFEQKNSIYITKAPIFEPRKGLYGCNMAFRRESIGKCRFDERLPLYGWQEDWDFASQISARGKIGQTNGFVGIHQGVKNGRSSGKRLGYSQIANPIYLYSKGTMNGRKALTLMMSNVLANHLKLFRSEPWIDRRGRVVGNWLALNDFFKRSLTPERTVELG